MVFSVNDRDMANIAGIISNFNDNNDDKVVPRWLDDSTAEFLTNYARQFRPRDNRAAAADWRAAYDSYYPQSSANATANLYGQYTKDIIGDKNTWLGDYEKLRTGNISAAQDAYGDMFSRIVGYNLGVRGARDGYGGRGNFADTSSYGKALLGGMAAGGATGLYSNIFNNLGREATASYGSREDRNRYLIDLFARDPIGGYAITAANRSINPYLTQLGLAGAGVSGMGGVLGQMQRNLQGWETIPGATSRITDAHRDAWSTATGGLYGQDFGSQPGQDTATTMGLIGTAASIYGGSNQYKPPAQSVSVDPNAGARSWQSTYSNYNPSMSYPAQNPYGNYNYGMSYAQPQPASGAQDYFYQNQAAQSGLGGLGGMF